MSSARAILTLRIRSMLDAAIWYDGESHGVICPSRSAARMDARRRTVCRTIADLAVMAIAHDRRCTAEKPAHAFPRSAILQVFVCPLIDDRGACGHGAIPDVKPSFGSRRASATRKSAKPWELASGGSRTTQTGGFRQIASGALLPSRPTCVSSPGTSDAAVLSAERMTVDGEACIVQVGTSARRQTPRTAGDIAQGAGNRRELLPPLTERLLKHLMPTWPCGELDQRWDDDQYRRRSRFERAFRGISAIRWKVPLPIGAFAGRSHLSARRGGPFPQDVPLTERHIEGYVGRAIGGFLAGASWV